MMHAYYHPDTDVSAETFEGLDFEVELRPNIDVPRGRIYLLNPDTITRFGGEHDDFL